ncbi:uncharacterized protein LOC143908865 [Temnothorax americanus]|uniref:uncharacterized protein LOC143908865 n=1 Tax=Temnothorax americanus TaxID=1964332 RepID=UPI0040690B4F
MATERDPTALRKQRGIIKSSCTRIKTYIDSIDAANITPSVVAQLEERRSRLDNNWSEYNSVQLQLEMTDDAEHNDRAAFEEAFYNLSAKMRELLNSHRTTSRHAATPSPSSSMVSESSESATRVRLPEINLPTFSGKYDEWFPFFDVFNSIIHADPSLNNVQKLQYLRTSVTGEASDVIGSLETSGLNYSIAWDLLKERYDNKRIIVHKHVEAIMELPSMSKENARELRQIADGASKHIHALQALRRPTSHWDDLLAHPTLQKTRLGWILAGRLGNPSKQALKIQACHATITNLQIHEELARFWQQEDISNRTANYTIEEAICKKHFADNVSQNQSGRYIVKLPVKEHVMAKIGQSRDIAMKRLIAMERRFKRDPNLEEHYARFMQEYIALGHMKLVNEQPNDDPPAVYLPHHCVVKMAGQSFKIRVVFDASCKTSTGVSLNDALRVGPVVQPDLISLLIRFRFFLHVFVADIIKMYRQILVHPSQTHLQRILWRRKPDLDVETYESVVITYGTAVAAYLATECLNNVAEKNATRFPVGSIHIKKGCYVDDVATGADTKKDLEIVCHQVMEILRLGAFELSKWASNCPELLKDVQDQSHEPVEICSDENSRILGMQWDHTRDTFQVSHNIQESHRTISKRTILSGAARLFDPLGLLGPVIVIAKLILQDLWKSGSYWDESVPQDVHARWSRLEEQLSALKQVQVPRCVKFTTDPQLIQIHGFCDASQQAYGACIYVRTKLGNSYRTELLCSKSRVAPLKAISLPRLELQAILLLAELTDKVSASTNITHYKKFLWSDFTIALNWITSPSRRWEVFVANRVGKVQRLTKIEDWRHIPSSDNPADILSRGLYPHELVDASLWWHGPVFLQHEECRWPNKNITRLGDNLPERRKTVVAVVTISPSIVDELIKKHSNLSKIHRIIAYCLRFRKAHRTSLDTESVSHSEISYASDAVCKAVQRSSFPDEHRALSTGKSVSASSKILSLSPFIDETGLIRVGGRLKNSELKFDACHPILLPRDHEFTKRIIRREHVRNMHAGTQATMAAVRQRFWPLSLRSTARKIIRNCVTCFKAKPSQSEAVMVSLPSSRVTVSRPFSHCGVDYAGPVSVKEGKRRNARFHKAYIAIFVCFATKAVHIELVSDLTTESFIGALRRFMSRRGKPACIYSDNGTTFVGAHKQIKEFHNLLNDSQVRDDIKQFVREQETSWSFIPPNAPHFGGLWEAAVKSAKYHMARIIGNAHLTFEEMQTVLCEVEAILNSRPLTQLSDDPNDFAYLSPGHFLVGTPLNSFPCHDLHDINENRLTRWQRVEQIKQHFWRRWSSEYLNSLQERTKWKVNKGIQLKPEQLVLIKQQGLAPLQWHLGRVQDVHTGPDGATRVATVRTAKGAFMRPLSRLAVLPIDT